MLTTRSFLASFGQLLKEKRQAAGLTQKDIAKEMGYTSPQFISNWERGLIAPPLQTIKRLIRVYKCDAEEIFQFVADAQVEILKEQLLGMNDSQKTKSKSQQI